MPKDSKSTPWKWTDVWRLFSQDEQRDACICQLEKQATDRVFGELHHSLLSRLAKATKFRGVALERLLATDRVRLAEMLMPRVASILTDASWKALFASYYFRRKSQLMCAFLDGLGIPHDETGEVDGDFAPPDISAVIAATALLERTYSAREIGRYLAVLVRHNPDSWQTCAEERDRLLGIAAPEPLEPVDGARIAEASDRFSVLDRVIIQEIVRSVVQVEGSLSEDDLVALVDTVMHLNENWHRAYFHQGLMDGLLPTRELQFDRPEENDVRRGWYLAGAIAGLARTHAIERLVEILDSRSEDFNRTVSQSAGPGAAIARTAFRFLIEAGRLGEALRVLDGQLSTVGLTIGEPALDAITTFIREGQYGNARKFVDVLRHHPLNMDDDDEDIDLIRYQHGIERRFGQCLQAEGNFDAADRTFRSLQSAGLDKSSPDLAADLALVRGKFKSATDLRLPESAEQRRTMRDALKKGKSLFISAVEQFGIRTPKACYALAVLDYLLWSGQGDSPAREQQRELATTRVLEALMAIQSSDFEHAYRDIGALGQCQFMLAVLKMNSFDEVEGREAMAAWRGITGDAGRFPKHDVRVLLDAAEIHDSGMADEIAESVWKYRRDDALAIIGNGPWVSRSSQLRIELLELARSEETPRAERMRLWCSVIPPLNRSNEVRAAESGLDDLESLAEDPDLTLPILEFISVSGNIDPAWRPAEQAWAKIRLFRKLGRDTDCGIALRSLFYMVRDASPWEAEQIVAAAEDWNLDGALRAELASLLPQRANTEAPGVEERLAGGERVRVVFVGGNEVQARYDDEIRNEFSTRWPGVDIVFEHSAWSSNWGRDLDRLTRLANGADATVLMYLMRTMLGRRLREALERPWIPCTSTGKGGMSASIQRAAIVGLTQRQIRTG